MQARRERSEQRQEDFVVSLGRPFLAHRLRRLSEQLVDELVEDRLRLGIKSPPRSSSTLLLLEREESLAVTEIAARLRLSHPLIIKMVEAMTREGFLTSSMDSADRRRRCVSLTEAGRAEARRVAEFTKLIDSALEDVAQEVGFDLYAALVAFDDALQKRPLSERLRVIAENKAKG